MSIRFGRGSTRRGWSTHEKHARHRAHDPAFLRLGPGVGGYRAYLRGADLHLPGSLESRRSALERIRERALSEAPLPHAARDAARILVGLGARVFSGRGRGLEPLRRVFLLSVHRDVPIASQSGAGAFDRGLVRPTGQVSVLLILSIGGLLLNRCILLIRRRILFWDPAEKERLDQERIAL